MHVFNNKYICKVKITREQSYIFLYYTPLFSTKLYQTNIKDSKAWNPAHSYIYIYIHQLQIFFFSTQLYFTIFTFLFVTTRQSSTYQQSITDFKVRTLVCIRTLVTSDNTYTPNNAPKATGNGLIQYGTVITRSILLNFSQEITNSLPVRARNGCLLWVTSLIYALLLSVQCCVYIRDKLDRVITAPDLTTQTSTVYIWQTTLGDIIHNKTPDKWSMGY